MSDCCTRVIIQRGRNRLLRQQSATGLGGGGSANQVAFWATPTTLGGDSGLLYNSSSDQLTVGGGAILAAAALTTTATDGFVWLGTCPGVPTGVPTAHSGRVPLVIDSTDSALYGYIGSVWVNLSGSGGGGFTNPMTTAADLIVGGSGGSATRLGKGSDSQVLTVDPSTHLLVWATPGSGFADPTTTKGDLIAHGTSTTRLPVGTNGQYLEADSTQTLGVKWNQPALAGLSDTNISSLGGHQVLLYDSASGKWKNDNIEDVVFAPQSPNVIWAGPAAGPGTAQPLFRSMIHGDLPASDANPMTTQDDLIIGGSSGLPTRLGKGADGQVLTVNASTHHLDWETPSGGGLTADTSASVYNSTAQSIPNATPTIATFDSEHWDTAALHSTSSNTSRLTAPTGTALHYHVTVLALWASNAVGTRTTELLKNGSTVLATSNTAPLSIADNVPALSADVELSAGDYVEARFTQDSTGALNVTPVFSMFLSGTGGGSGGGNVTYRSDWSTPPSSPSAGDLWLPDNSIYPILRRNSGNTAWEPYGDGGALVDPALTSFAWANQGTASLDTSHGGMTISQPGGSGVQFRMQVKSVPSTPYTVTVAFDQTLLSNATYQIEALFLRDSSSGKMIVWGFYLNSLTLTVESWSNATTFNAAIVTSTTLPSLPAEVWLQLSDDGTTRSYGISYDGKYFQVFGTDAHNNYATPDQVGWGLVNSQSTHSLNVTLVSYRES